MAPVTLTPFLLKLGNKAAEKAAETAAGKFGEDAWVQTVTGNQNQVMGQVTGGQVVGNVTGDVTL